MMTGIRWCRDATRVFASVVTIVQLIYREAFLRLNLGTAAALSIVMLVGLLLLNAVFFRGLRVGRGS